MILVGNFKNLKRNLQCHIHQINLVNLKKIKIQNIQDQIKIKLIKSLIKTLKIMINVRIFLVKKIATI